MSHSIKGKEKNCNTNMKKVSTFFDSWLKQKNVISTCTLKMECKIGEGPHKPQAHGHKHEPTPQIYLPPPFYEIQKEGRESCITLPSLWYLLVLNTLILFIKLCAWSPPPGHG